MLPKDTLCRAALFPTFIRNETFDDEALLQFFYDKDVTVASLSVASFWLCRNDKGVHNYGLCAARVGNEAKKLREKRELVEDEIKEYLGFYKLLYHRISEIKPEHFFLVVRWVPEHGQDEHFQIDLQLRNSNTSKSKRKLDIAYVRNKISEALEGPVTLSPELMSERVANLLNRYPLPTKP